MSKIKMSFSLILAIFLVGILSTAAFAKDPYGLKPVQVQGSLDLSVPFTFNAANGESSSTTYDLHVIDPSGADAATFAGITTAQSPVIVKNLTPGTVYTVKLTTDASKGPVTVLSKSTGVVIDPHNADMYKAGIDSNGNPINSANVDVTGNGMKNSNLTGYNNTRKNRSGQKIHGFYQNNTNSCASCHQTHTAANGESLLFKDGVYSTCSACHDGTTGAYNSFAPVSSGTVASISGTFNVQAGGHNGSLHEADGSLKVAAAPGGNIDSSSKQFGQEFDCASCHAAHGSGSASENNLNLDPLGWGAVAYGTASNDAKNGKLFNNINIVDTTDGITTVPTSMSTPYILVKTTAKDTDINNPDPTKNNFWWKRAGVKTGDIVIQTYRWTNTKYVPDYSLWLRELGYPYKANTLLKDAANKDLTMDPNLTIVWRDGFAFGPSVANISTANVSIGIDVETTSNIASLYDTTPVYQADGKTPQVDANGLVVYKNGYLADSGTEMSKYCASCHVDYLSITRTDNTGVYSQAHRHATAQDSLTCVRCHYAHGSEAQIMKDANDNSYFDLTAPGKVFDTTVAGNDAKAISYFVDPNPSSAIKRYTGMSVCYACHGKGEQFIGNPNSNAKDKATGEFLKGGNPGSDRTDITK